MSRVSRRENRASVNGPGITVSVESKVTTSTDWQHLGSVVESVMERLQERRRAQADFARGKAKMPRRPRPGVQAPAQLELPLTVSPARVFAGAGRTAEKMP